VFVLMLYNALKSTCSI